MKRTIIAVLLFINSIFLWAQPLNAQFPSLEADGKAYEYARRLKENGSWIDYMEAGLWASGVTSEEKIREYIGKMEILVAELNAHDIPVNDVKGLGEHILVFLYDKKVLKTYSENQTRLDQIFISGSYNCVSSAVLYMICALSAGLDVECVRTEDHCFVVINTGDEKINVETTNRYGFDPGKKKEYTDSRGQITGYASAALNNYKNKTEISKVELISLILHNRISDLEKRSRFAEVVPLAVNYAALLSTQSSYNDLLVKLFNLTSNYIKTGKEDQAITWIQHAQTVYPGDGWQGLLNTAIYNKIAKLIRARKPAEARSVFLTMQSNLNSESRSELENIICEAEAVVLINGIKNQGDIDTTLRFLEQIKENIHQKRWDELLIYAILNEADRIGKTKNWIGGILWLSNAIEIYGSNNKLETALKTFRQNRINQLHNEFAALFNKKDYAAARVLIEKALQEFPGNPLLSQDLIKVEKILN